MKRSTSVLVVFVLSVIASLFGQSTKTEFNALVAKRVTFNADFQKDQEGKPSLASQVNALHVQQKAYDAAFAKHNEWAKNPPSLAERNAHDAEAARLTPLVNAQIAKVTALLARVRDYKQRLAAHNANRCYYPPNNPSYC